MSEPLMPCVVDVGCHRYTITRDRLAYNKRQKSATMKMEKDALGLSNHRDLEIVVPDDLPLSMAQDTLWHEIKHCVWRFNTWDTPTRLTEEQVLERTTGLELDTLRRNPDLQNYLFANEDYGAR